MLSCARYNRRLVEKHSQWMIAIHYRPHMQETYRRALDLFIDFLS